MSNMEEYNNLQTIMVKHMNLKKGDIVKPVRTAKTREMGWSDAWVDEMTENVGNTLMVVSIHFETGVLLNDGFSYPIFVLEKLSDSLPVIKLTCDYSADIQLDGSVKVGCQHIDFETLEKVYNAAKEVKCKKF